MCNNVFVHAKRNITLKALFLNPQRWMKKMRPLSTLMYLFMLAFRFKHNNRNNQLFQIVVCLIFCQLHKVILECTFTLEWFHVTRINIPIFIKQAFFRCKCIFVHVFIYMYVMERLCSLKMFIWIKSLSRNSTKAFPCIYWYYISARRKYLAFTGI